jgi:hypothetical protein
VRLDHLLSKEQLAPRMACAHAGVHCFLVEHWLFILVLGLVSWLVRSPAGVRNGGVRGRGGVGTLLGPEGTAAWRLVSSYGPVPGSPGWEGGGWLPFVS